MGLWFIVLHNHPEVSCNMKNTASTNVRLFHLYYSGNKGITVGISFSYRRISIKFQSVISTSIFMILWLPYGSLSCADQGLSAECRALIGITVIVSYFYFMCVNNCYKVYEFVNCLLCQVLFEYTCVANKIKSILASNEIQMNQKHVSVEGYWKSHDVKWNKNCHICWRIWKSQDVKLDNNYHICLKMLKKSKH